MSTNSLVTAILGSTMFLVCGIAIIAIWIIANWKIFAKAGEPGWKSIIPFYNGYTLFKFTWNGTMFWIFAAVYVLATILANLDTAIMQAFGGILMIVALVIEIMQLHKESKVFGHGVGFTLGLIFLNPIFTLILAFGSSEYKGALAKNDETKIESKAEVASSDSENE